jgi:hypothetical protein
MKKRQPRWFTPILLFAWASFWLYAAIHLLAGGELWFRWYRGATRILVQRDTHPYHFWGCAILFVLFVALGVWHGIVELRRRRYIQHRRSSRATMMQDLQHT